MLFIPFCLIGHLVISVVNREPLRPQACSSVIEAEDYVRSLHSQWEYDIARALTRISQCQTMRFPH